MIRENYISEIAYVQEVYGVGTSQFRHARKIYDIDKTIFTRLINKYYCKYITMSGKETYAVKPIAEDLMKRSTKSIVYAYPESGKNVGYIGCDKDNIKEYIRQTKIDFPEENEEENLNENDWDYHKLLLEYKKMKNKMSQLNLK